jgi:hypothetical protein
MAVPAWLIDGIAKRRSWLGQLIAAEIADTQSIAKRECCSDRQVRMTLSLAFLSPTIVKAAIEGRPAGRLRGYARNIPRSSMKRFATGPIVQFFMVTIPF